MYPTMQAVVVGRAGSERVNFVQEGRRENAYQEKERREESESKSRTRVRVIICKMQDADRQTDMHTHTLS
jgi:hypothetical protein